MSLNTKQFEETIETKDCLSGKHIDENSIETYVKELIIQPEREILPEAMSAVKKGLPFAESGRLSSVEVVAFIISEYMREWNKCHSSIRSEFYSSSIEVLNGNQVSIRAEADKVAAMLKCDDLSDYLEGLIGKQNYRPFLLSWARYATDKSVERVSSNYNTMINGKARDRYKATNTKEALLINDTRAAMLFFDRIGELRKYAAKRGMSAMAMRDSIMLPEFDFDADGIKRYDIGGNTIEVSITPDLGFKLYDVNAQKEIRSFPKKSDDPKKAETCAKDYSVFKKTVLDLAKERTSLIHKMHLSGEYVDQILWQKVYVDHPVIRCLSQLLVWQDESNKSFTVSNGKVVNEADEEYIPQGKIRVAHVLDMKKEEISAWQQALAKAGRKQLFDQIWEPVISWDKTDIEERYKDAVLTKEERNALKKALKQRGIDSKAEYEDLGYYGRHEFGNKGTMNYGDCLFVDFTIDPDTKEVTFCTASTYSNQNSREMNAILFELDKATISSQVARDNDIAINMQKLSVFTASQITDLLNLAIDSKADKCTAMLLDYKNEKYPEYADINEFSLDW